MSTLAELADLITTANVDYANAQEDLRIADRIASSARDKFIAAGVHRKQIGMEIGKLLGLRFVE